VRPLSEFSSAFRKIPLTRGSGTIPPLHDAADDDHRVGPHDVDDDLPAKLGEIVDSHDRVLLEPAPRVERQFCREAIASSLHYNRELSQRIHRGDDGLATRSLG
jgi:hypothetical protein